MTHRPGTLTAYRWELRKLVSQKRTYIGIGAATLLPVIFVVVLELQSGGPRDQPLAGNLRHTGLAITLVVLTFISRFGAQIVTALVAGDIVAAEDSGNTLKMILTRSLKRGQILAGKTLASFTYVISVLLAFGVAGVVAGTIAWGFHPLRNIDGTVLGASHALALTAAALGLFAVPLIAVAAFAIFLSAVTQNSAASIVGTLVYAVAQEAIGGLVHENWARHYLLSDQLDGWHGIFMSPTDWTIVVRCLWVSAIFAAVPLSLAHLSFARRDVAGE